jgi:hypothetical protein
MPRNMDLLFGEKTPMLWGVAILKKKMAPKYIWRIRMHTNQLSLFPNEPDKEFWDNFNKAPPEMQSMCWLGYPYDQRIRGKYMGSLLCNSRNENDPEGSMGYKVILEIDGKWYAFHPMNVYPVMEEKK